MYSVNAFFNVGKYIFYIDGSYNGPYWIIDCLYSVCILVDMHFYSVQTIVYTVQCTVQHCTYSTALYI